MANPVAEELMSILCSRGLSVGSAYSTVLEFIDKFFKGQEQSSILLSINPAIISVPERTSIIMLGKPIPKYRAAQLLMGASQKLIQPKKKERRK